MDCRKILLEIKSSSSADDCQATFKILRKVAENILKAPEDKRLRILKKDNKTIVKRIINVPGGVAALIFMGFHEENETYELSLNAPLNQLEVFIKNLEEFMKDPEKVERSLVLETIASTSRASANMTSQVSQPSQAYEHVVLRIKRIKLPELHYKFTNKFLRSIEQHFHAVLAYENKSLQDRAKALIPLTLLEKKASERIRVMQKYVKKGDTTDPEISFQDCLLGEVLAWFKNEFFEWVDAPLCDNCKNRTKFAYSVDPKKNNKKNAPYYPDAFADRIEVYKCEVCPILTRFPRFNDLNILLETRRGRCGEWANVFTLFCRVLKWDARFVVEEGDHVWTEVYSNSLKRWIHCDPCENIYDKPLMYESGWGKSISYVMAYSVDEVQDVTWRYSSKHKEVLTRRKYVSEGQLLEAIHTLRNDRQRKMGPLRKKFVCKRTLMELVEFLTEKKPTDNDKEGRSSGSLMWRLTRGEIQEENTGFVWSLTPEDLKVYQFQYFSSLDKYVLMSNNVNIKELHGWSSGVFSSKNIFRKEEHDWKNVYLARQENCDTGNIAWKFEVTDPNYKFEEITIFLDYTTFVNGEVNVSLSPLLYNSNIVIKSRQPVTVKLENLSEVTVLCSLSGGKGDVAWQHAQLFRQQMDCPDFSFSITFKFKHS